MIKNIPIVYAFSKSTCLSRSEYDNLLQFVSEERKNRAKRFLRFEDSCRTVIAELILGYALKKSCGLNLHSIKLAENQWKKPIIEGHEIHFNITHSGDWVMCAVDNFEIGIDVEKVKKIDFEIVPRFFSKREHELFLTCNTDTERLKMFSTIWVLKESYIKAIGKGLYCPLDSFSVIPDNIYNVKLELIDPTLPYKYFKLFDIDQHYRCAVCCSSSTFPEKLNMVTIDDLTMQT